MTHWINRVYRRQRARIEEQQARIVRLEQQVARLKLRCSILTNLTSNITGLSGAIYVAQLLGAKYVGAVEPNYDILTKAGERIEVKTASPKRKKFDRVLGRDKTKVYDWLVLIYRYVSKGDIVNKYYVLSYEQVIKLGLNSCYCGQAIFRFEWTEEQLIERFNNG
jgi:hypothetical protein